ncbi:stage III sporulation protein AB [Natranaerovirga hydrolytica]|uniref:Stage III sporulation protein AB n=1 Tax=Natranaerovirga hydrolytica TaxID=680378 RepID=A0A4R1MYJ1_9FIRM|nr:stage III sporulation protein AB [Natranaerovirga hydrolytica]TCK98367.1 stage III sporulation protein AB [Natranaerovirga hydrolytica]
MYIKVLGILLTITSSTLIGLHYSRSLVYRLEGLQNLKKTLIMLRGEIKYSLSPLPEALEDISNRSNNVFKEFLKMVSQELKKFDGNNLHHIWCAAIEQKLKNTYLKKQDLLKIEQIGETLGYLDKEMQINTINMYIEQLEEEIKFVSENNIKSEKLYKNLGFLGGILIAILFI